MQDLPDDAVRVVVVERLVRLDAGRDDDGQHDVAALLAGRVAHDAADGLHDVDLRVARSEEEDGVERGDVDALGEAADVGEDAAGVWARLGLEPADLLVLLRRVHAAVDVLGLAPERRRRLALLRRRALLVRVDDGLEHRRDVLRADLVDLRAHLLLDDLAERDGALHRLRVARQLLGEPLLREGFPAADDLRRVVDAQRVVAVLEQLLDAAADVRGLDGEDEHLVVDEQAALHGLGERQDVQVRPVHRFVVHRAERDVVLLRGLLRGLAEDARRGRHVEALVPADERGVVHLHEVALVLVVERRARRAVRLVAHDEIERGQAVLVLRVVHDVDRVVRREHHGHVVGRVLGLHLPRQARAARRRRVGELVHERLHDVVVLLALLADVAVRADREAPERRRALLRPLRQRLRQEREARQEEEHALARARDALGDLQAGERLARAARHDELAAVVLREALRHLPERDLLVRPERLLRADGGRFLRREARPVDDAPLERREVDLRHRRLLVAQRLLGVLAPVARGRDDEAPREGLLARRREKAVDVRLRDAMARRVVLALDGVHLACRGLGDEVDAGVARVEAALARPDRVRLHAGVELAVGGLGREVGPRQVLEVGALLAVGDGGGAVAVEDFLEVTHGARVHAPRAPVPTAMPPPTAPAPTKPIAPASSRRRPSVG